MTLWAVSTPFGNSSDRIAWHATLFSFSWVQNALWFWPISAPCKNFFTAIHQPPMISSSIVFPLSSLPFLSTHSQLYVLCCAFWYGFEAPKAVKKQRTSAQLKMSRSRLSANIFAFYFSLLWNKEKTSTVMSMMHLKHSFVCLYCFPDWIYRIYQLQRLPFMWSLHLTYILFSENSIVLHFYKTTSLLTRFKNLVVTTWCQRLEGDLFFEVQLFFGASLNPLNLFCNLHLHRC